MIQLNVLTGRKAGVQVVARRFPFAVGRGESCGLRLEDPGVWERHLDIHWQGQELRLVAHPSALVSLNGDPVQEVALRSGDLIGLGSVNLRFGLSPMPQRGLRFREILTWIALAAVSLGQVALIYLLST